MTGMNVSAFGLGWYEREDYPRILEIMEDAHLLPRTYDAWRKSAETGEREQKRKGVVVIRVVIKAEEFLAWCRARGLNVDKNARMRFGNEAVLRAVKEMK